ncbi:hypothetical protein [Janthinobacterium sp. B9-8]|uniref:hypothetical protein n=1 Tax=Janthinobacterium sp. B9-8 TaxID=1236179 RepID=UPI00061CE38E|nr:hypothetical protein [Janthinobacterium sp. B9-8]AMC35447.1 hypothetical protein VN23_12890 [Janthinobacterium sp. B9-8]
MSKNAWNRPAGADGFVPVIVLRQRLAAMYGARWQALFSDESAVIAWQDEAAAYLYAEGIKWQWMRLALDRLRGQLKAESLPPSLGELAAMCRPETDYAIAFEEAKRNAQSPDPLMASWSSPELYWAAFDFGFTTLRSAFYRSKTKVRWIEVYARRLEAEHCPAIPAAEPVKIFQRATRFARDEAMAALRAQMIVA